MRPASIQRGVAQSGRHARVGAGCRCAPDRRRGLMRSHVLLLLGLSCELSNSLALAPPAGAADHGAQLHRRHWCGGWPGFCVRAKHPSVHACWARCVSALHVAYNSREFGLTCSTWRRGTATPFLDHTMTTISTACSALVTAPLSDFPTPDAAASRISLSNSDHDRNKTGDYGPGNGEPMGDLWSP